MIKLIKDLLPFKKGEVLDFGSIKNQELIDKGFAIKTKISTTHYNIK